MTQRPDIETLATRVVYENRWMRVREDEIRYRDGSTGIYGVVVKPNFVVIAPLDSDGKLHLVEQYRYPIGIRSWEFPQGAWEGQPDADPLELARGELREETGLDAGEIIHAGHLFQACGYATQSYNIYLARNLRRAEARLEATEQDLITRAFATGEVLDMVQQGVIKDASTIASLGLLRLKGLL
ncbi:NUDIX domain-containing protein [Dongia sedimenti]|uniref:NUDIX hydrolase n=1 Tax=Dongia sedimenti TaxID=3064282 RepID=A0ABU0YGB5_9PROT|nr:NUDIX hydrolase [Rhodospirillaceae bacterium R-7]